MSKVKIAELEKQIQKLQDKLDDNYEDHKREVETTAYIAFKAGFNVHTGNLHRNWLQFKAEEL